MATVGWLNIGIGLNTKGLSAGAKRARQDMSSVVDAVGDLKGALVGIAAAAGVGMALNAVKGWTTEAMTGVAAQGKLADQVGSTTEAIAGLRVAYQGAGLDTEMVGQNLSKLGVKLAEAASGTGPAKDALAALGLSAEQLAGMDRAAAFSTLADAIGKVENPAQRAQIAVALFEEEGTKLDGIFRAGAAGIDAAADKAERFGLALSRTDAAQVEAANAAFNDLGMVTEAVGQKIAVALSPYLEAAADAIVNLVGNGDMIDDVIGGALEFVAVAIGTTVDTVDTLGAGFTFARSIVTDACAYIADAVALVGEAIAAVINLIPGVEVQFGTTAKAIGQDLHALAAQQRSDATAAMNAPSRAQQAKDWFASIKTDAEANAATVVAAKPKGPSAFDPSVAAAKVEKEKEKAKEKEKPKEDVKLPANEGPAYAGAMERGSAEARSTILAAQGLGRGNPMESIEKTSKETAVEGKKQTDLLAEIARSTSRSAAQQPLEFV
jgi:hypothetical protein